MSTSQDNNICSKLTSTTLMVRRSSGKIEQGWHIVKPYYQYGFKGVVVNKDDVNKIVHPIDLLIINPSLANNDDFVVFMQEVGYIFPGIDITVDDKENTIIGLALYEGCDVRICGRINGLICYQKEIGLTLGPYWDFGLPFRKIIAQNPHLRTNESFMVLFSEINIFADERDTKVWQEFISDRSDQ